MQPLDATVASPPRKQPRGCFFYGCLTAIVLAVVGGIALYFGVRYALERFVDSVVPYTEAYPMELPKSELPEAEYALLQQRIRTFREALDAKVGTETLVLTSDELNALIAKDPSWSLLRDAVHVSLRGDEITAEVAIPLTNFVASIPGGKQLEGRYLNGTATLKLELVDQKLTLDVRSVDIRGKSLPPAIMAGLRAQNLSDLHEGSPELSKLKSRLRSLQVVDGKLTIQTKPGQ